MICLLVGVPLNLLLIWLLLRRTSKEMRVYSQILVQTCVVDLLVLVLGELVQPVFFVDNGIGHDLMAGPLQIVPNPANHIVFMLWFGLFYFSTEGLAVQFVFRYLTICRKMPMNTLKYFALLTVALLFETVVALALTLSSYPGAQHQQIDDPKVLLALGTQRKLTLALRSDSSDPFVVECFLLLFLSDTFIYATILICAVKIHSFLKRQFVEYKLSKWSELNGQITKTLLVQSFLPSVPLLMCTFGVAATIFALPSGNFLISAEMLITAPLCWLPLANPLVTILTVKHYRREVRLFGQTVLSLVTGTTPLANARKDSAQTAALATIRRR
uniref:G protein-coupled receptor n=1 Tax=Globodera rostochiensis TaxID=31243 RepID=A0A914HXN1_GLORO